MTNSDQQEQQIPVSPGFFLYGAQQGDTNTQRTAEAVRCVFVVTLF